MANYDTTTFTANGIKSRMTVFFANLAEARARRRVYAETVRELAALSDRDLADFGMHRSMIEQVAHEAAYGKAA